MKWDKTKTCFDPSKTEFATQHFFKIAFYKTREEESMEGGGKGSIIFLKLCLFMSFIDIDMKVDENYVVVIIMHLL